MGGGRPPHLVSQNGKPVRGDNILRVCEISSIALSMCISSVLILEPSVARLHPFIVIPCVVVVLPVLKPAALIYCLRTCHMIVFISLGIIVIPCIVVVLPAVLINSLRTCLMIVPISLGIKC